MNRRLIVPFIIILLFTLLLWHGNRESTKDNLSLKVHKIFVTGKIESYNCGISARAITDEFKFTCTIKGRKYNATLQSPIFSQMGYEFVGKIFPVIYDSTNPKNYEMLIFPRDFQEFGLPYPDSLNWVVYLAETYGCPKKILTDTIKK
jgi:hypothetical protein